MRRVSNVVKLAPMALMLGLAIGAGSLALGQVEGGVSEWEMRVCADPNTLPFSNRQEEGFENRVAEIIADELGATLSYDWFPQGPDMVTFRLRAGSCDVIMGVPDGSQGLLTTITYYRSPYVFVYREDSGFEVETFDDEILHELQIAVQNVGIPPHDALLNRGLSQNIVNEFLEGEPRLGAGRSRAVIDAVVEGEVDLALVWGPVAGYYARRSDAELVVKPVQPQFEPPFISQSFPMTMGVRLGDEAFRDLLDVAIANRWEDIQQILSDYSVPVQQVPRPRLGVPQEGVVEVGFLTPTITGSSAIAESLYDVAGEAARNGALLAESSLNVGAAEGAPPFDVLTSSVPTAEAAIRAAERMAVNNDVALFVGGLGDGQAESIADVAGRAAVPFFNIGSPFIERECTDNVFHVEASGQMYLDAMAAWQSRLGNQRFFILHEEGAVWARLAEVARDSLAEQEPGSQVVGVAAVPRGMPSYHQQIRELGTSDADAVLLLLGPRDQIAFMAQYSSAAVEIPVVAFPGPVTQSREFLAAAAYRAPTTAARQHLLLWETTLEEGAAAALNQAYMSRFGEPMDSTAWAAYQAIAIYQQAATNTGTTDLEAMRDYLTADGTTFGAAKGVDLWFDDSHQLRQPLYVADVDGQARWGNILSEKVAVASLTGQVPSIDELAENPRQALEAIGGGIGECQ